MCPTKLECGQIKTLGIHKTDSTQTYIRRYVKATTVWQNIFTRENIDKLALEN